ncbi:uncharacterized protein LOC113294367 [Papaver somniferum]|uniref:uncharacterized protein LOC113294367 n=1 Tax=Papaver somniferum TaxID=3469 RepID=UPI000E6FE4CE|nr:uncharacterized protein LOC113294367 [Papaver somniferum]
MINIWTDKWIPGLKDNLETICGSKLNSLTLVTELIDSTTQKWNSEKVRNNFPQSFSDAILKIKLFPDSNGNMKTDTLRWLLTKNGKVTVKSLYAKLQNNETNQTIQSNQNTPSSITFWTAFWNLNISQRIKIFLWKCINNALPVRKLLGQYRDNIDTHCIFWYRLILRSETGSTIQTGSGTFYASSPEEAEALTLLEAARWETKMHFSNALYLLSEDNNLLEGSRITVSQTEIRTTNIFDSLL